MIDKKTKYLLGLIFLLILGSIFYIIAGLVVDFPAPFLFTMGLSLFAALMLPCVYFLSQVKK